MGFPRSTKTGGTGFASLFCGTAGVYGVRHILQSHFGGEWSPGITVMITWVLEQASPSDITQQNNGNDVYRVDFPVMNNVTQMVEHIPYGDCVSTHLPSNVILFEPATLHAL